MKKFVSENWYKLMIGSSLLMASFGFMVHSVSPAMANNSMERFIQNSNYKVVATNTDGSINVRLSDEQLDKIIPKNTDGSINVKISSKGSCSTNGTCGGDCGRTGLFNNECPTTNCPGC